MSDANNKKRIFSKDPKTNEAALSPKAPLPNIVRIEILNKVNRNRYLGTFQQISSNLRTALMDSIINKGLSKFYGFMKGSSQKTIDMTSTWAPVDNSGGGIIGTIRSIVAGGQNNFSGTVGGVLDIGRDITGISMSTTGSSSIKRYSGSDLNQFSIDCGWYIPEQHKICIKSLRTILSMAYPSQIDTSPSGLKGIEGKLGTALTEGATNLLTGVKSFGVGLLDAVMNKKEADKAVEPSQESVRAGISPPSPPPDVPDDSKIQKVINNVTSLLLNESLDLFGKNLTFDPLPVRCSIGQFIDIEPLVITGISVIFSNETFVNKDGRHLPIFISINIQFKFWMQPPPNMQFMQLLGEEMFGNES